MIHNEILDQHRQDLLQRVANFMKDSAFYLAGGTALSLQRGYRKSVDFDFFTPEKFDPAALYYDLRDEFPAIQRQNIGRGTCDTIIEGVQVSFFRYPYSVLDLVPGTPEYPNLKIASVPDIACMKMEAIANRGARKDFYDLYQVLKDNRYTAEDLFSLFQRKYRTDSNAISFVVQGLSYFEDARDQQLGDLFKPADWKDIEKTMTQLSSDLAAVVDREYYQKDRKQYEDIER